MDSNEMFGIQDAVFILTSSVDNFCGIVLAFIPNCLAKGILDRWVVAIYKVSVDKLYRKGGFS